MQFSSTKFREFMIRMKANDVKLFSSVTGINESTIRGILRGNKPNIATIEKVAKRFGLITLDIFFDIDCPVLGQNKD